MDIKEKATKDICIRVQPTLHKRFKQACEGDYKNMSQVVKDLMLQYVKQYEKDHKVQ